MKSDFDDAISSFVNKNLQDQLKSILATNKSSVIIDFSDIDDFSPELGDFVMKDPIEAIDTIKYFINELGPVYKDLKLEVRLKNLPKTAQLKIKNLRSKHIGKLVQVTGLIKIAVSVKPTTSKMTFECQSCGHTMDVAQTESIMKQPVICTNCGKKGRFKIVAKEFIDTQRITLEEAPEDLEGGEQPEHVNVLLKGDLVDPKFEKSIIPGNKVTVTGIINEEPIITSRGKKSRMSEMYVDASFLEAVVQGFEEMDISKEEEITIKEMAKDKNIYNKFRDSIAPNIYGYEAIKDSIVLQLFGGVRKQSAEANSMKRGDVHILMVGDPGCLIGDERVVLGNGAISKIERIGDAHLQHLNQPVLTGQGYTRDFATTFHYYQKQPILEIVTESGKSIVGTYNHPLLTKEIVDRDRPIKATNPITGAPMLLTKKVSTRWKRLDELKVGDELRVINWIPCTISRLQPTNFVPFNNRYGPKSKLKLPSKATPEFASLIGYILGDGWVTGKYKCGFLVSESEKELLPKLLKLVKKELAFTPNVQLREQKDSNIGDRIIHRRESMHMVEINNESLVSNLGFIKEKRVPDFILSSGNAVVSQFLRWLFTADGCVFSKGRGRRAIQLKAKNLELLRDVQILLLRFGVHSRILEADKIRNAYNLVIRRSMDFIKFNDNIGFALSAKQKKLNGLILDTRFLPHKHHSKRTERIIAVRRRGYADVYDIEVPKGHRFIANGVISHNTAKSDMLKYVSGIAPKARYVTGMGSSGAGLTATIIKDDTSKSYILEAGAMPLTNGGLLCIDEIDKMNKDDRVALHEGLEQQTISIAKANIHSTLSAQTSVLAAANPKLSRFDPYQTVPDQIDLPPTLINRFDLIFIMKDRPNPDIDKLIASRILESNRDINKNKPAIETLLLKKYIAYAKQHCRPKLSAESISLINDFYLRLRGQRSTEEEAVKPIPISPRQLNAVIRLAEASAKVRLSEYVTVEDAKRAIDLTMAYLSEVGVDKSTGEFDIDRIISGIPSSRRGAILKIKSIIRSEIDAMPSGNMLPMSRVYEAAENSGIKTDDIEQALYILKREGEIFEPKQGFIKLVG